MDGNTESTPGPCEPTPLPLVSTDLVHVQDAALVVEARVQLVEHGDDLHGRALRTHGREAHDVREQHGYVLKLARRHGLALPQPLGHVAREDGVQEVHRSPLLLLQGLVGILQRRLEVGGGGGGGGGESKAGGLVAIVGFKLRDRVDEEGQDSPGVMVFSPSAKGLEL